jgi:FkbH-like protein
VTPASLLPNTPATVTALFAEFDGSSSAYASLARTIEAPMHDWPEVRVALLATCTSEILHPYLKVEAARRGLRLTLWSGPFGQIEQQVLDASSALYAFQPDIICVFPRLEDWAEKELTAFSALGPEGRSTLEGSLISRIETIAQAARRHSSATLLWFNFAPPQMVGVISAPGLFTESSLGAFCSFLNAALSRSLGDIPGAFVFDLAAAVARCGTAQWTDNRMALLARIPFSSAALGTLATSLARTLRALRQPPRKCLVLDLDNTLWGGILGEVGLGGIKLGDMFPGNAHLALHKAALALRQRGVLLAVASKNNEAEALEALTSHPDCLLRPIDFAALEIHWEDKATSLRRIAQKLSIGTDALAFFDDNPAEREWVRSQMPEVAVIEVPRSPADYAAALEDCECFDSPVVSSDDLQRAVMYQQQEQRRTLSDSSGTVEDFLRSLNMRVQVGHVSADSLDRVVQLLAKTNQFNLTTRRHTSADITRLLEAGAIVLWARVSDRFGDNGLTGVAIAVPEAEMTSWRIDSLLLSCRVIGRQIETGLLSALAREIAQRGAQQLIGEFLPSGKNSQVSDFFARHGFTSADDNGRLWIHPLLTLDSFTIPDYLNLDYVY